MLAPVGRSNVLGVCTALILMMTDGCVRYEYLHMALVILSLAVCLFGHAVHRHTGRSTFVHRM